MMMAAWQHVSCPPGARRGLIRPGRCGIDSLQPAILPSREICLPMIDAIANPPSADAWLHSLHPDDTFQ